MADGWIDGTGARRTRKSPGRQRGRCVTGIAMRPGISGARGYERGARGAAIQPTKFFTVRICY